MGVGLVPQGRGIFPTLTVRENLTMAARSGAWTFERMMTLGLEAAPKRETPAEDIVVFANVDPDAGYRGIIALEERRVIGMAYGYRGVGGQWWHDAVVAALEPDQRRTWPGSS